jgi:ankyrin repeat protein
MPVRHLPVRPDLDQLRRQAKELLAGIRAGAPEPLADLAAFHPGPIVPETAKLADAQLVLARSYQVPSWNRLVQACELVDAIWRDDVDGVRALVSSNPKLLHESALVRESNWGPPLSYAANLGRNRIIRLLYDLGARDLEHAMDRAALQSRVDTAELLYDLLGRPRVPEGALAGAAYTLSVPGTEFLFRIGAQAVDERGRRLAPADLPLETDSRNPAAKHAILEMYVAHGLVLPDTPTMALHRGRIDLLEAHLRRDPDLVHRTFSHEEIYPPEIGCHDEVNATHGTPLAGSTLLHMCVDYDEYEIAQWLLARGARADTPAEIDRDGFGGHTALFGAVVSQPNFWMNHGDRPHQARFAQLLLDHGANPNARATIRKRMHPGYGDDRLYEYHDVTPLSYGARFSNRMFVNKRAMELILLNGGAPADALGDAGIWADPVRAHEVPIPNALEIFGRPFVAVLRRDGWAVHYPGAEGKRGPLLEVPIPHDVRTPRALRDYLADVCHEWATPEHDRVRWLDR